MSPRIPLFVLTITAFAIGIFNAATTGGLVAKQPWNLGEKLILVSLIFWWYHLDKSEKKYKAGPLLNIGVVGLSVVAVPIYLFRSRGTKQGFIGLFKLLAFVATILAILVLGGIIGKAIAP